jgi:hypothetical protein
MVSLNASGTRLQVLGHITEGQLQAVLKDRVNKAIASEAAARFSRMYGRGRTLVKE